MMRNGWFLLGHLVFLALSVCHQAGSDAVFQDTMTTAEGRRRDNNVPDVAVQHSSCRASHDGHESTRAGCGRLRQKYDVLSLRDCLNELVEASVADVDQQLCNLAFLKTHKTGSTTLASLFYRYGVRHGLKVARYDNLREKIGKPLPIKQAFPKILAECAGRVDIMHYHIGTSSKLGCTWEEAEGHYRDIMRDPENINFVTIFREPREQLLSYYYYFIASQNGNIRIDEFLQGYRHSYHKITHQLGNPLAGELGITTVQDLNHFIDNVLPKFKLVMVTDRFDEGLMVLRNLMGWHLMDMTYIALNKTTQNMTLRVDKEAKKVATEEERRPCFEDLPVAAQQIVDKLTRVDRVLYEAGKKEFEKALAPMADGVGENLAVFRELQAEIEQCLSINTSSAANDMYLYEDFFHVFPSMSRF